MGSRYFDWTTSLKRFIRFDAARAEDVNDALDELSAGLETLDGDVDRAIKLPPGTADQTLNLTPGARANKYLGFDASGNVRVSNVDIDSTAVHATNAQNAATAAAASESAAASSASAASASASNAATSASQAATSATNAANSASAAAASQTAAASSESSAAASAATATTQAGIATTKAGEAAASASAAATSASQAATSATNAANSASAAATSAANAEAAWDALDDRYLGAKTADPTVDNDGNPLQTGALYWNTSTNRLRVYTGSTWQNTADIATSILSTQISDSTTVGRAVLTAVDAAAARTAIGAGTGNGDVTQDGTQTLTNKTLTAPVITENIQVISGNTTAVRSRTYVLTASLTLTLPASPAAGDWVSIVNRSWTTTAVIGRNGTNIMGLAEDMTLDNVNASLTLIYADATRGWVLN